MPAFLTKSLRDKISQKDISTSFVGGRKVGSPDINMEELTGAAKSAIQKLLGKAKNPMASMVEGTANLSAMVRSNQFFDDLILKNNELKKNWDAWDAAGRVGDEPRIPFLYNNKGEARKYAGARGEEVELITSEAGDAAREIDRWVDPSAKLKPIDTTKQIAADAAKEVDEIINPVAGKWALKDYAESFIENSKLKQRYFPTNL